MCHFHSLNKYISSLCLAAYIPLTTWHWVHSSATCCCCCNCWPAAAGLLLWAHAETDRRALYLVIDAAPHTVQAVPITGCNTYATSPKVLFLEQVEEENWWEGWLAQVHIEHPLHYAKISLALKRQCSERVCLWCKYPGSLLFNTCSQHFDSHILDCFVNSR